MKKAINLIEYSNKCVYITGKAGTGKTTLLKYIANNLNKNVAITASTGIAAINAGGVTLHSFFGIPLEIGSPNSPIKGKLPKHKWAILKMVKTVIIDEVSMVRADVMDFINKRLQMCKGNKLPFGGVQIVMFGDLYQLPPVVRKEEKSVLELFYDGFNFYNAAVFNECKFEVIELTHVFRQSDENFVNTLNHIREFKIEQEDMNMLRSCYDRGASQQYNDDSIHICALKRDVKRINEEQLGEATRTYMAEIEGDFSKGSAPCDMELKLRIGAKVMMLTNDSEQKYCNGTLGKITKLDDDSISVLLDNGLTVEVGRTSWKANEYELNGNEIKAVEKGSCTQFPVTLAWAITIHKSQGLTFDKVTIHARNIFISGQLYVALSRCRSIEGIVLDTYISRRHIMPNFELLRFENEYRQNGMIYSRQEQNAIVL